MARILIVDDEQVVREALAGVLKMLKHEVIQAEEGEEALRQLGRHRIDVVMTDIFMPGVSGLELVQHLKQSHPLLKVVVMTGVDIRDEIDALALARQYGADAVLPKPFGLDRVREVLEEFVENT